MNNKIETGLLLCSLLGEGEPDRAALARLSDADWDELLRQSERHRVAPLLYRRLKDRGMKTILPAGVEQGLRERYYQNFFRNTQLYKSLAEIFMALQDDNLPAIPLKGAHLCEVVYGNIALRPIGDLDLLVRKEDLNRVAEKLQECGYTQSKPFWMEAVVSAHQHLPPFTKPGVPQVEAHWSILSPTYSFNIDPDGLWSRAQPAVIGGVQTLVLSPEDLLLHLCLHTSVPHRFAHGIRALCDVAETLCHYRQEMDWDQVLLRARQWRADKCVYLTLRLAGELLNVKVPDDALEAIKPNDLDPKHVIWARESALARQTYPLPGFANFVRAWRANGLQGKVAHLLKVAFPSRGVMATMYPAPPSSKRIYLYYLVRVKKLIVLVVSIALRSLCRDRYTIDSINHADTGNALVDWLASPVRCQDEQGRLLGKNSFPN